MIQDHNHDGLLSTLLGGLFGFLATVGSHPVFHAFLYGFVGALGGLLCKLLWAVVIKKFFNKKPKFEDPQS